MLHLIKRIIKEEFSILSEDVKLAEKILNSKNIPLDNPNYLDIKNYLLKNNSIGFLGEIVRLSRSVNDFKSTAEFILNNKDLIKSLPKQISSYNSLNELKDDIDNMSNYRLVKKLTNKLTNKSLIKELLNNLPNNSTMDNIDYFLNNIQSTDQKEFLRKTDKYNDIDSFYYDLKYFIENHKIGFYFDNVLNTINKMNKYAIKLLYANKNMILARIIDYSASYELGSKSWCIVGDAETFNNYTKNGENNQYFFFNFNGNIPSNLNMIAFTLNDKNEVTASHDRYDAVFNNPIEYLEKLGIKDKVFLINSREMIHKNLSNIDKKLPLDYDEQIIRIRYDIKGEPYEQQQKNYKSVLNNICNDILYLLSSKEVNFKNHLDLFIEKFEQFFVNAYDEKTYKVIKNYKKINMISYLLNNFDNLNSKSISKENFIKVIKKIYLSDIKLNNQTKFDLFYFLKNNNVDILKLSQLKKSKENKNLSDTEFSMLSKKGENLKPIIQNKLAAIRNGGNFNMSYPEVIYAIDNGYKNIIEKHYKNLLPFFKKNQLSLDDLNVYKKLNLLNDIAKSIKFKADNYTPDSLNSIEKSLLDIIYKPKKLKEELDNTIITCKKCGHQWYLKDGGDDPYTCHECNPKTLNENLNHYKPDVSPENLEDELYDAQGEKQQFLGPDDENEDLFGDYKNPEIMLISDIANKNLIDGIKKMIDKQGIRGRKIVDGFKKSMLANKPILPVVVWRQGKSDYYNEYSLISGRHRLLASLELGFTHIPVIKMYWRKYWKDKDILNEKCWKGYTQKGMKTMFGKQYPNCVKLKK